MYEAFAKSRTPLCVPEATLLYKGSRLCAVPSLPHDYMQIGPHVFSALAHLQTKKKIDEVNPFAADDDKDVSTGNVPINLFGKQVKKSLLKRANEAGQTSHHLFTNFRSHNGTKRLASSMAYKGQMFYGDRCQNHESAGHTSSYGDRHAPEKQFVVEMVLELRAKGNERDLLKTDSRPAPDGEGAVPTEVLTA
ncbi:hypothetical protein CONLIGDRAFT_690835 [Coniochaeta ligniaria NRRL 30616]|uniref:Uncharacterized protein n=1 Tax=Coniochaeta ligniaria NRRL 30616 TaxID=1408157 RepID=A0A1J7J5M2_9PEZI|nr:hypothetical protein CONLIGDRAFT_690835 [Coniochaeta ligniaria NRRL 30616]